LLVLLCQNKGFGNAHAGSFWTLDRAQPLLWPTFPLYLITLN
jgi:hypothetical protein